MKFDLPLVYTSSAAASDGESLFLQLNDQAGLSISFQLDRSVGTEAYNCIYLNGETLLSAEEELLWLEVFKDVKESTDFMYSGEVMLMDEFINAIESRERNGIG